MRDGMITLLEKRLPNRRSRNEVGGRKARCGSSRIGMNTVTIVGSIRFGPDEFVGLRQSRQ